MIGVAGRDTVEEFEGFVATHGLEHVRTIADVDGDVWDRFSIRGQPAWVFIDGETGRMETAFGALGTEGLIERVEALSR